MWRVFLVVLIVWVGVTPIAKRCCGAQIALAETPPVLSVYPSGASIPENLLRLSMVFASPVEEAVLPQIALQRSDATEIKAPFLEQELWSPDGKTLTLLLHPGRVKTGLIAHDKFGRASAKETTVALVVNHSVVKQWQVEEEDRTAPDPTQWNITLPESGTLDALQIKFEAPIDVVSSQQIAVLSPNQIKVDGEATLAIGESHWIFSPRMPWKQGAYHILVHPRLEDVSGNEIHEIFEHDISTMITTSHTASSIPISIN